MATELPPLIDESKCALVDLHRIPLLETIHSKTFSRQSQTLHVSTSTPGLVPPPMRKNPEKEIHRLKWQWMRVRRNARWQEQIEMMKKNPTLTITRRMKGKNSAAKTRCQGYLQL
eukprot:25961-Karenia_brevis.AAC.1